MKQRTNQGGSVLTFVIVGVVLVAVMATGIYLVNQRSKHDAGPSSQTNISSNQSSSSTSTNPQTPAQPNTGSSNNKNNQTSQSGKTTIPQNSTPATGFNGDTLPTTGPVDAGLRVMAFGTLIGLITAYVRSHVRKQQIDLL